MKVGVLLPSSLEPQNLVDTARRYEAYGVQALWYPDTRFLRDPFVGMTLLAQATTSAIVGTAVTDPYLRHPALLAMAAASVAELAPQRVRLGLGAGASGLRQLGILRARPLRAVRAAVEAIGTMTGGGTWSRYEQPFPADDVALEFPSRRTPVWLGTRSPGMLRLAGEVADGVILGHLADPAAVDRALDETRRSGRRIPAALRLQVIVGGTADQRQQRAREVSAWVLRQHAGRLEWLAELGLPIPPNLDERLASVRSPRDIGTAAEAIGDDLATALTVQAAGIDDLLGQLPPLAARGELMLRFDEVDAKVSAAGTGMVDRLLRLAVDAG
jgi:5,10-methylenetetrahydromethanopterin reductase